MRELEPGMVEWKARSTTMVLTRMQEMQRTKLMPKAACRAWQDHIEGRPRNTSEQRKQSFSDNKSRKLSSELLALTIGVDLKRKKMIDTAVAAATPRRDRVTRMMPMIS